MYERIFEDAILDMYGLNTHAGVGFQNAYFLTRALASKKGISPCHSNVFTTHPIVKVILCRFC
jgi:hypothetical protein